MPSEVPVKVVLEPGERKLRPTTPYDAKFSLPYCLSALIHHGELGVLALPVDELGVELALAALLVLAIAYLAVFGKRMKALD